MASVWISPRNTRVDGQVRYYVRFRTGGRESKQRHGGAFATRKEAEIRKRWIQKELAEMRDPDIRAISRKPAKITSTRSRHSILEITWPDKTRAEDAHEFSRLLAKEISQTFPGAIVRIRVIGPLSQHRAPLDNRG